MSRIANSWEHVDNSNNALKLPRRVPATRSSTTQRASSASAAPRATNLVQVPHHEFQVPPRANLVQAHANPRVSSATTTRFKCHATCYTQVKVQAQTKRRPSPDQVPTKLQECRTVAQRCRLRHIFRIIQKCHKLRVDVKVQNFRGAGVQCLFI